MVNRVRLNPFHSPSDPLDPQVIRMCELHPGILMLFAGPTLTDRVRRQGVPNRVQVLHTARQRVSVLARLMGANATQQTLRY